MTFEEIKARLESVQEAYETDLAGVFDISTKPSRITLKKRLSLKTLEHFLVSLFGDADGLSEIPLGGATIERFRVEAATSDSPFEAELELSFSKAHWPVMDGLDLALDGFVLDGDGGALSGEIDATATAFDRRFDVRVRWPEMIIEGHLEENAALAKARKDMREADTPAKLAAAEAAFDKAVGPFFKADKTGDLISDHGLSPPKTATLNRVALYAAPRVHYLSIGIAGHDLVQFHELVLRSADLALVYAGGTGADFSGTLDASVTVGQGQTQTRFHLTAARTETGWTARAIAAANMTVEQMVSDVSQAVFNTKKGHSLADAGVPGDLANKTIHGHVVLRMDTAKSSVSLELGAEVDGGKIAFSLDMSKAGLTAKAKLTLDDLAFEVDFFNATQPVFAGQFKSESGAGLKLAHLAQLSRLSGQEAVPAVDANLSITLRDALLAGTQSGGKTHYLLAADVDGGIDLSGLGDLPLVGSLMPQDMAFVLSLAPILPSGGWSKADVTALKALVGKGGPHLPDAIPKAALGVSLKTPGHAPEAVDLPLESDPAKAGDEVTPAPQKPGDDALKWKDLNRKFGPVALNRVGMGLDRTMPGAPLIRVAMDGGLDIAGLKLSLIGLEGDYGLKSKSVSFQLNGLGLQYERGPLKIAGAFANMNGDYLGKATLGMKSFTLSAMGGFTMITDAKKHKTPSMFLYGVLNVPIGGPAFFFVEGLAAGFGVNRRFKSPPLDTIRDFPLVKDATKAAGGKRAGPTDSKGIGEELALLHDYLAPELGQYFAAIGVKFTSFKLLDSFVLLVVSFGREVEIDLLGVSTYQTPPIPAPGLPALARIELNLEASFRLRTGALKVHAELSRNSYVYSSLCHLSGGFAFYSWFGSDDPKYQEHAGEFILTVGGYPNAFSPPAHYPRVRRVNMTYRINANIYIKGSAYFALTPQMFMAGGSLAAAAKFGKVSASFKIAVDFTISWEPYFYTADARLDIRASWWIFSTHAYAELHVWGPSFSGHARVHWSIVSFDVSFGSGLPFAMPVTFDKFCASFLPHEKTGGTTRPAIAPAISVTAGQIEEHTPVNPTKETLDTRPLINPKTLEIRVDAIVPATALNGTPVGAAPAIGCPPMHVTSLKTANLGFSLHDSDGKDATAHFHVTNVNKPMPLALWGTKPMQKAHGDKHKTKPSKVTTVDSFAGLKFSLAKPPTLPVPTTIKRQICKYDVFPENNFQSHIAPLEPTPTATVAPGRKVADVIAPKAGSPAERNRRDVMASLGLTPERTAPRAGIADTFRVDPLIVEIT